MTDMGAETACPLGCEITWHPNGDITVECKRPDDCER